MLCVQYMLCNVRDNFFFAKFSPTKTNLLKQITTHQERKIWWLINRKIIPFALTRKSLGEVSSEFLRFIVNVSGWHTRKKMQLGQKVQHILSRLPCYVFCTCMLTNSHPNANKLSWAFKWHILWGYKGTGKFHL